MATERSFGSTTLSSRLKVTNGSNRAANFGLCSRMLNGPRIVPKTFRTSSTTPWNSTGTSDFPVTGAILGMNFSLLVDASQADYSPAGRRERQNVG